MIKMTEAEWTAVQQHIPKKLAEEIEDSNRVAAMKFPREKMIAARNETTGEEFTATCERLSEFWVIAPAIVDGAFHRTRRVLMHAPTAATTFVLWNRKDAVSLWEAIQAEKLCIELATIKELGESPDWDRFMELCRKFGSGH